MIHPTRTLRSEDGRPAAGGYDFTGVIEETLAQVEGPLTLRFLPGEYHFYPDTSPRRTLYMSNTDSMLYPEKQTGIYLEGKRDISFVGEGASFIFHGPLTALALVDCENLEFSGFDMDYACPSTIDFRVGEIREDGGKTILTVNFDPCYHWEPGEGSGIWWSETSPYSGKRYWSSALQGPEIQNVYYQAETGWLSRSREGLFSYGESLRSPGPGELEIRYDRIRVLSPGDYFQIRNIMRDGCGIFLERCKALKFKDLRIGYMYAIGVVAQCCETLSFESVRFRAWKPGRMTGSAADMIQFSSCRGMLTVRRCEFFNPHDDPINVHGIFLGLESLEGRKAVLKFMHGQTCGFPCIFKDDLIQFYDAAALLPQGDPCRVLEVRGPSEEDRCRIICTLDREPVLDTRRPIAAENRSWIPDVLIAENRFEQIPTRGLLVSSGGRVVVRDNFFIRTRMSGIYISGDARNWYEAGPVQDLTIEHNIFQNCGEHAIRVEPTNTESKDQKVHRGITIGGNVIRGVRSPVISIKSSGQVRVEYNVVEKQAGETGDWLESIDSEVEARGNIPSPEEGC